MYFPETAVEPTFHFATGHCHAIGLSRSPSQRQIQKTAKACLVSLLQFLRRPPWHRGKPEPLDSSYKTAWQTPVPVTPRVHNSRAAVFRFHSPHHGLALLRKDQLRAYSQHVQERNLPLRPSFQGTVLIIALFRSFHDCPF